MAKDQKPVPIFISYVQEDERLFQELRKHLSTLKRNKVITLWHHGCIPGGTTKDEEIDKLLQGASIILILMSANYLACWASHNHEQTEVERALARKNDVRIIPIIIGSCDWKNTPFGRLQSLLWKGKPISERSSGDRNAAWTEVVEDIRSVIENMNSRGTPQAGRPVNTSSSIDFPLSTPLGGEAGADLVPGPQKRRGIITPMKLLMIIVVVVIVGISARIVFLTRTAAPTTTIVNIHLQIISPPNYANVEGTLKSYSLSEQNIQLNISFVNNGKVDCTNIKFRALNLSDASGRKLKPNTPIDQSWNLRPTVPLMRSVQFQLPQGSGSSYTLTLSLDVGGCATPHDNSRNRYANYQGGFSINK